MLTHIVIWKYHAETPPQARQEHIARLRGLATLLPEIKSLNVGTDILHLPRSYDTGLVAVFSDRAALDAYTEHPYHVAVADFGRKISEHVASVDFESED